MKECPKCGKRYDDSMNFCIDCGVALKDVGGTVPPAIPTIPADNKASASATKKKSGCLKKILMGVAAVVVGILVLGYYANNAATYLRVEPNQLVAPKCGGEIKVDIDYDGYVWNINHVPDWVDIDEDESSFQVTVGKNMTGNSREGTITIQSGKQLAQVAIAQSGVATVVRGSESELHFDKSGGTQSVSIETDGCELNAEGPDFISTSFDEDGKLTVTADSNSDAYRTGRVRVYEDNQSWYIAVSQGGKCNLCNGTGKITCSWCSGFGSIGYGMFMSTCSACGGSGSYQCSSCQGTGEKD